VSYWQEIVGDTFYYRVL